MNDSNSISAKATIVIGIFAALLTLSTFKTTLEDFKVLNTEITLWSIGIAIVFFLVLSIYLYSLGYIVSLYPILNKIKQLRYLETIGDIAFVIALGIPLISPLIIIIIFALVKLVPVIERSLDELFIDQTPSLFALSSLVILIVQLNIILKSIEIRKILLDDELRHLKSGISNLYKLDRQSEYYLFEITRTIEAVLRRKYYKLPLNIKNTFKKLVNLSFQDGYISNEDQIFLLDLWDFRNHFVHKLNPSESNLIQQEVIDDMIKKSNKILEKIGKEMIS